MEVENDKIQYPDMGATLESQHQALLARLSGLSQTNEICVKGFLTASRPCAQFKTLTRLFLRSLVCLVCARKFLSSVISLVLDTCCLTGFVCGKTF